MGLYRLLVVVADRDDPRAPAEARVCLEMLAAQLDVVKVQVPKNNRLVRASARQTEVGHRLMEIPDVGPLLASAFVASISDAIDVQELTECCCLDRLGVKAGLEWLGSILRVGNRYLRQMLVVGAMAVIRYAERHGTMRPWLIQLLARRMKKAVAVALANKTARIVWALMTSGERYRNPSVAAV